MALSMKPVAEFVARCGPHIWREGTHPSPRRFEDETPGHPLMVHAIDELFNMC